MRVFNSIRWTLQLWHGLLLLVVISAFGFTAYQLERTEQLRTTDTEIQRRISLLVNTLRDSSRDDSRRPRNGGSEPPSPFEQKQAAAFIASSELRSLFEGDSGYYFTIWMHDSAPIARSANAPPDIPRPGVRDATPRIRMNQMREAFIFAAPVDCVLVGHSMADVNSASLSHAALLSGSGAGLLGLGLLVAGWLTARALHPVGEISATAKRISSGDLSQRIDVSETESELGELAAVLNSTFSRLDEVFEQQARFTSDAAHELRTPLTVLLTQTQAALARERSAGEYREALQSNLSTAQRMRRLVESLLELARLDARQEPLRRVPCDLAAIAADAAESLRPLADARNITLNLDLRHSPCEADPDRITQVITNVLKNAIDYNRDHGEVRLATDHREGFSILEVTDTGIGITAEDLPHIFERFYRADTSRSNSAARSGLGLAISKAIVDAHGGSLSAKSEAGQGTTVRAILPEVIGVTPRGLSPLSLQT